MESLLRSHHFFVNIEEFVMGDINARSDGIYVKRKHLMHSGTYGVQRDSAEEHAAHISQQIL